VAFFYINFFYLNTARTLGGPHFSCCTIVLEKTLLQCNIMRGVLTCLKSIRVTLMRNMTIFIWIIHFTVKQLINHG